MSSQTTFAHLEAGVRLLGAGYGFDDPGNPEGVLGFGYGWLARDGEWQPELGLVILSARGRAGFPYLRVAVEADGVTVEVPCCSFVLDVAAPEKADARPATGEPPVQPGAPLSLARGFASGTGAAVVSAGTQRYLLTAAHVFDFDWSTRAVFCGRREIGTVSASLKDDGRDLAFVELAADLSAADVRAGTPDGAAVAGVGALGWDDFRHRGRVFCPTRATMATPFILAGNMTLHLARRNGRVFTQREMIMTEGCTHPGDSGTALQDQSGWVMGVLSHGRKEFSFFTSVASLRSSNLWPVGA